ncbi:hypothetical protein O3P69_012043 [Scylla paramamosain]|uniref:Major facilitator superfamily (MFS) profile domain-containing protein n=1 Tax=Scylla paramamosain TaxID=85552 RepID=A0AAW0SI18_SCYPA
MYMLGYFVASPVSGYLSDKYGRKIMLRLGYVGFLLLDLMSAWLPLLSTILVSRFFLGCLHAVCASVSFVLTYFIRDWRILQTAVTLPALLILPVLWTPRLRIITLCIYVDFLMVGMVYFGLSLSGTNISENPFVYMVLSGVMEVPAYSLTIPIVHRYGRKRTLSVLFVISGIILLCLAFSSAG